MDKKYSWLMWKSIESTFMMDENFLLTKTEFPTSAHDLNAISSKRDIIVISVTKEKISQYKST